ncbi:MAG: twin-arginine translocase TatA/TatE family subunit [Chloroflexi bacterium]|nr:twin-arginine translocase TatA/TatE family subunit [Chloroflexota bacterium]
MPFRLGPTELIIILVIVMMIFGVGRLPQVGNAMGKAIRAFRRAQDGDEETEEEESSEAAAFSKDYAQKEQE